MLKEHFEVGNWGGNKVMGVRPSWIRLVPYKRGLNKLVHLPPTPSMWGHSEKTQETRNQGLADTKCTGVLNLDFQASRMMKKWASIVGQSLHMELCSSSPVRRVPQAAKSSPNSSTKHGRRALSRTVPCDQDLPGPIVESLTVPRT
jgi:hypothetical protein